MRCGESDSGRTAGIVVHPMAPPDPYRTTWFLLRWSGRIVLGMLIAFPLFSAPAANQAPVIADQTFELDENAALGSPPSPNNGVIAASDPDLPANQLTFRIVGGNSDSAFALDPVSGRLTVANPAAIDFEKHDVFQLTIEVADDAGGELFSSDNAFDITPDTHDTRAILLQDFNRDGLMDLVEGNYNQRNRLLTNNGSMGNPFSSTNVIAIGDQGSSTRAAATLDFDGNGAPDIVFANDASPNHVALNNDSPIPFDAASDSNLTGDSQASTSIAVADTDADDHPDIVVGNGGARNRLYRNNGTGSPLNNLIGEFVDEDGFDTRAIALADFDGDGLIDLAEGADGRLIQLRGNNGFQGFNPFEFVAPAYVGTFAGATRALLAVDLNGDGFPDLIEGNAASQANLLFLNLAAGPGLEPFDGVGGVSFSSDRHDTFALDVGDLNGDGRPDLVVGNSGAVNRIHLHNGTSSPFGEGNDLTTDAHETRALAIADVNGDGAPDIVAGNKDQPNRLYLNNLRSASATITIRVNNLNDPPTAANQSFSIAENPPPAAVVGTATATDQDQDQVSFAFSPTEHPAFAIDPQTGVITVKDTGLINFEQTARFTIDAVATDNGAPAPESTAFQIEIDVLDRNDPPAISAGQVFAIDENSPDGTVVGSVAVTDEDLANSPPDTHRFAIAGANTGVFEIDQDTGQIRVRDSTQLDAEVVSSFMLSITVTDGGLFTDSETVIVNLNNLPEPPALPPNQVFMIPETAAPGALVGPGEGRVQVSPTEPGVAYSFAILGDAPFAIDPATGALTVANPTALDYEPLAPDFFFNVTVRVSDDNSPSLSSTAVVRVNVGDVNEPPSLAAGQSFDIVEHLANGSMVGTLQFSDPDLGDTPLFSIDSPALSIDAAGIITVADYRLLDFETAPTLTPVVTLTDREGAGLSDTGSITINLSDRNDPPVIALPAPAMLLEDSQVVVTGVAVSENENGSDPLLLDLQVSHGALTLLDTAGLTLADSDGSDGTLRLSGSLDALTAALSAGLRYTPAPDYSGADTLIVIADDQDDAGLGGRAVAREELAITIIPVNDAPSVSVSTLQPVQEDAGPQAVADWAVFAPGPSAESGQLPSGFLVSDVAEGFFSQPPEVDLDGNLTFLTATNVNGEASFTLRVRDDGGTANNGVDTSPPIQITLIVAPVNDAPSFTASNPPPVNEDSGSHILPGWIQQASAGPPDETGQSLSFVVENVSDEFAFQSPPTISPDGTLSFSLAPDANGAVTFDVFAMDDGGVEDNGLDRSPAQTFMASIVPVNDPPTTQLIPLPGFQEDAGPQTVASFAEFFPGPDNESGQSVSTFLVSGLSNPDLFAQPPTINSSGDLSFTPAANANGTATFTVAVRDDGGAQNGGLDTSPGLPATIVILPGNDPPVIQPPPSTPSGFEDAPLLITDIVVSDVDASNESLRVNLSIPHGSLTPTEGTALIFPDFDGSDGTLEFIGSQFRINKSFESGFIYTPAPDFFGQPKLTVTVNDLGNSGEGGPQSASIDLPVNVEPVNDLPSTAGIPDRTVPRDSTRVTVALGAAFDDIEDADHALLYEVVSNTNPGLFGEVRIEPATATLILVPNPGVTGASRLNVRATDTSGARVETAFFVVVRDVQQSRLSAAMPEMEDWFGQSVSVHGDLLAVGAWQDDRLGENAGAVRLFGRIPGAEDAWEPVRTVTAPDAAAGDAFGRSLALEGDTLVVGAVGAVHVFQRHHGGPDAWGRVAKLTSSGSQFGWCVSLSGDTLLAGALLAEVQGVQNVGAVFLFERHHPSPDQWGMTRMLAPGDPSADQQFGSAVSIEQDTAIVGSPSDGPGSVYVFERNQGGSDQWGQVAKRRPTPLAAGARFGGAVALSGDDAVIGAYRDDVHGEHSGSAFVLSRNQGGAANWGQAARLDAADGTVGDFFGYAVAIDGGRIFVGCHQDDDGGSNSGSVHQFLRSQNGPGQWGFVKKLTASDASAGAMFGFALSAHQNTLAVGVPGDSSDAPEAGAVRVIREGTPLEEFRSANFALIDLAHADRRAAIWGENADPDNDGDSNLAEFVMGLDPNNAASRFRFDITAPSMSPAQRKISFGPIVPGRSYALEFNDRLGAGSFVPEPSPLTTEPNDLRSLIVSPGPTFQAWRVRVSFP